MGIQCRASEAYALRSDALRIDAGHRFSLCHENAQWYSAWAYAIRPNTLQIDEFQCAGAYSYALNVSDQRIAVQIDEFQCAGAYCIRPQ